MLGFLKKNKKPKKEFSREELKWNRMWDLWVEGKVPSPYSELMSYQSEVNNGGHYQYFLNSENIGDVTEAILALSEILPVKIKENLDEAYKAYLQLEKDENIENAEAVLETCDGIFFQNEQEITDILEKYCGNNY